jgi:TM2 domain-containing membrane protein YozV
MGKITAAVLSILIPGLGQFYAGRLWRGLGIFFATGIVGLLTGGFGLPIMYLIAALDAYLIYKED